MQFIVIIHIIQEACILPRNKSYEYCIIDSIQCHHNDIANYLIENKCTESNYKKYCFQYYNFQMIKFEDVNSSNLFSFSEYDYAEFLRFCLTTDKSFDINEMTNIQKH